MRGRNEPDLHQSKVWHDRLNKVGLFQQPVNRLLIWIHKNVDLALPVKSRPALMQNSYARAFPFDKTVDGMMSHEMIAQQIAKRLHGIQWE